MKKKFNVVAFTANSRVLSHSTDIVCFYCKWKTRKGNGLTVDHIIPKSLGGKPDGKNVVHCCRQCNEFKDSKLLKQWEIEITQMIEGVIPSKIGFDNTRLGTMRKSIKSLLRELNINILLK